MYTVTKTQSWAISSIKPAKRVTIRRTSLAEAMQAAIKLSAGDSATRYVFATGNGWDIDKTAPQWQNHVKIEAENGFIKASEYTRVYA